MPKTEAGQVWREKNARLTLDLHKDTKARWDAYAEQLNIPTGRMVRMCVERCIAEDSGRTWAEDEGTETATGGGLSCENVQ